jgi:hypothetical protein
LLSTKALPLEVSAVFAGAICAKADELAKITKAAEIAANLRNVMSVLPLGLLGLSPTGRKSQWYEFIRGVVPTSRKFE